MKNQVLLSYTKGITRTPSDFLCEDGELAECVNLEVKGDELVPMELPVDMGITLDSNEELIYIHNISQSNRKNYITKVSATNSYTIKAFYLDGSTKRYYSLSAVIDSFVSCVSIGTTLIVYSESGPTYILFESLQYKVIGTELPEVSLSFNLTGAYRLEDEVYTIEETGENNSPYKITGSTETHQAHVNKFIAEKATGQGKFMFPFFVRYALRLYNGEYVNYSAPVLMLPSIYTSPSVYLMDQVLSGGLQSADFLVGGYVADLQMKVNNLDDLEAWKDIVKGISIFITRQTYSYNQAYSDDSNFLNESNWSEGTELKNISCEHIGEITEADLLDGYTVNVNTLPSGHTKWKSDDIYSLLGVQLLSVPTFERDVFIGDLLASSAVFYKYVSIDTTDILGFSSDYQILSDIANVYPLDAIEQSETLSLLDDYMSHDILVPSFVNVYNSRLNIANIKRILYDGYIPDSMQQQLKGNSSYEVYTYIHTESGNDIIVKSESINGFSIYGSFLYYPDTDAFKMVIVDKTNSRHATVDLVEDMYSNGAYYINLDGITFESGIPSISTTSINYELLPNKLFTSDVNNPFYFPLAGINTVGTGRILGISALTRPISQGQFGEYPLMAFCTDGNFALKVDSEGYYSGISPMQEDIILGQDKLTPLENSILAITKKGILITGASSDLSQIATQMEGKNFSSSSLTSISSNIGDFLTLITKSDDSEGFREFLEGARMAYDYSSDRVLIYNKNKNYSYVFLFNNGTVSKLVLNDGEQIITHVLDYPDSVIQTSSGKLYSLYEKEDINELSDKRLGFALTRPLKLGGALSMKSVKQIKNLWHRVASDSSVKYKLYGSNDNVIYYPLQSLLGKPYQYYRMAFFTNMLPKESFSGTAMIIDERRTNKLR